MFNDAQYTVPAVTDVGIVAPQVAIVSYLAVIGLYMNNIRKYSWLITPK